MDKWILLRDLLEQKKMATYEAIENIKTAIRERKDDSELDKLATEGHRLKSMLEAYIDVTDSMNTIEKSHGNIILIN